MGVISRTEHTPDDNIRLLPMSKKASVYKKELEIRERLAEIKGKDLDYINLLKNVENRTEFKHLLEDSELRLIRDSLPHLGNVELESGSVRRNRSLDTQICKKRSDKDITIHTFSHKYYDATDKV